MPDTLTYIPTPAPVTPFAVGESVEVLDRQHTILSVQVIRKVTRKKVTTDCGREWTPGGEWFDGESSYPFPSIRRKA